MHGQKYFKPEMVYMEETLQKLLWVIKIIL